METKLTLLLGIAAVATGQLVDDFECPDEFAGFYPHLISCDKYWHCQDGFAELKTCGNGLGFLDTDDTFTLEQCAELHLVECGSRTEIEPPISTDHCPRLYGTFPDDVDCGVFWKCQDGKPNKYNCPPGLAYDSVSRGCRWADQVPECSTNSVVVDDEGGEFQCPRDSKPGIFTKHAHPADCRQYFLCIGGVPREYGCPLGTVFDVVSGTGVDGKCTDPEDVPECSSYYGDADLGDINRSGADTGPNGPSEDRFRPRPSLTRNVQRNQNAIPRGPSQNRDTPREPVGREKSRPAPASLQQIVDSTPLDSIRSNSRPSRPSRPESRPSQSRPSQSRPSQFRPREEEVEAAAAPNSNRLQQIRIESAPETTQRSTSPRLQVLTDRPNLRTTFPKRPAPTTTERPTTPQRQQTTNSRFSTAGRPASPLATTEAPAAASPTADGGLPAPVKAAPGPNGEEYYYYYYYYDDEEGEKNGLDSAPGS
jgi:hypothetical protein